MNILTYLWRLAPFIHTATLRLSTPVPTDRATFLKIIDGSWSIDGGTQYMRTMPYRDIQQYHGVVTGNTFQLIGPFGFRLLPMQIRGEFQTQGADSCLALTIRTSLATSLYKMGKTVVALFGLLGVGALIGWFGGMDTVQITSSGLFLLTAGAFFFAVIYVMVVWQFHRQTALLLKWLRSQLGAV